MTVLFDGGATAQCDVSWLGATPETCTLELAGPRGEVSCDMHASDAVRLIWRDGVVVKGEGAAAADAAFSSDWIQEGGYPHQMRAAIDAMLGVTPYPVDPGLGRDVVALLEAAARSIATGSAVEVADGL